MAFSGFHNIVEMVTLDNILCPDMITDLVDEDWNHNVLEDSRIFFFRDLPYLRTCQPVDPAHHQILAVLERPKGFVTVPAGFDVCGFDIMDSWVCNSTLTNCGPIPEAFEPAILNEYGLIPDHNTALEVRDRMRQLRPDNPHMHDCEVWLITRCLP